MKRPSNQSSHHAACVGVTEYGNSAILVTVRSDGTLLDRRKVDLTTGFPTHPHHHEGSWAVGRYTDSPWAKKISLKDAIELIERVQKAAEKGAHSILEILVTNISVPIVQISLRAYPELPPTIEARIRDNRAQTIADTVMYRESLAQAAEKRGWDVNWYDRERIFEEAANALDTSNIDLYLKEMGRAVGPPWQAKHKQAAAAAIAALSD